MALDFFAADIAYSNLGGLGPDTAAPAAIRYVNVGSAMVNPGFTMHFDLEVTNRSAYGVYDAGLNGLNGRFAQINFAANTRTDLRVTVKQSCCTAVNCAACDSPDKTDGERAACYTAGCCCFGGAFALCHSPSCCSGIAKAARKAAYSCHVEGYPDMDATVTLPRSEEHTSELQSP